MFAQNIKSLPKHLHEYDILVAQVNPKPIAICITKTWFKENQFTNLFQLLGYQPLIECSRKKEVVNNNVQILSIRIGQKIERALKFRVFVYHAEQLTHQN